MIELLILAGIKFNPLEYVLLAMVVHWLADFVYQYDTEAQNKSSSNKWLSYHIGKYFLIMLICFGPFVALVNTILHWPTDYVTSRWTKRLWLAGDRHNFFVVIGLDQLIHIIPLILSSYYVLNFYNSII